jgi:putative exosortase-associated protein (TIGR04073 family)
MEVRTMGQPKAWKDWIGIAVIVIGMTSPALANISGSSDETRDHSYLNGMVTKLGRGIANVATCPLELVRTPTLVGRQQGYVAALTVGISQGVWRTAQRGAVGLFEVATFFVEIPDNFEPIMKPEFVHAHGDWAD